MSSVIQQKLNLLKKLAPPDGTKWKEKDALKFRRDHLKKFGKRVPVDSIYYPYSRFSTDSKWDANTEEKEIKSRFDELISGPERPIVRRTLDEIELENAKVQSAQFDFHRSITFKPAVKPTKKRRKLNGFQPAIILIRNNQEVKKFEEFLKSGNVNKVINTLTLKRAVRDTSGGVNVLDQAIYRDAVAFLNVLFRDITAQRNRLSAEIKQEKGIIRQYFMGRRPHYLGPISTKHIQLNGSYARTIACGTPCEVDSAKALDTLINTKMIIVRHKMWKQWQEFAKGLETRYKVGLQSLEAYEYNSGETMNKLIDLAIVSQDKLTRPSVKTFDFSPAGRAVRRQALDDARLGICMKHFEDVVEQWELKVVPLSIDKLSDDNLIPQIIDQLNKGVKCDKDKHSQLQNDFDHALNEISDIINAEINRKLKEIEAQKTANAADEAQLQREEEDKQRIADQKVKELQAKQARAQEEAEKELKRKQEELKLQEAKDDAKQRAKDERREKAKRAEEEAKRAEEETKAAEELQNAEAELATMSGNVSNMEAKLTLTQEEMDNMDTDDKSVRKRRNLSDWGERFNQKSITEAFGKQGLDILNDQGARLITSKAVIFDSYYLESPQRQMTELLLKLSEAEYPWPKFLPQFRLLKNEDDSADKFLQIDYRVRPPSMVYTKNGDNTNFTKAKQALRQTKIDRLYESQPDGDGTFTMENGQLTFGEEYEIGKEYNIDAEGYINPKAKYILVQENMGIPLLELISYCYDNIELGEKTDDGYTWTTRTVTDNDQLRTNAYNRAVKFKGQYAYDPMDVVKQLDAALNQLNGIGYLHRDIKLDNLCLDNNGRLGFIDLERCASTDQPGNLVWGKDKGTNDDIFYFNTPMRNGTTLIDPPNKPSCQGGKPSCDRYQAALALLNLGCQFNLPFEKTSGEEDYTYAQNTSFLNSARDIFNNYTWPLDLGEDPNTDKVINFFSQNRTNIDAFNLPQAVLEEVISKKWLSIMPASPKSVTDTPQRVTIEYDSMSEGDIAEIEKAMDMYSDKLEKYDSESEISSQVSSQKASLYDSSSDVSYQKDSSTYDSGSDVSYSKASYDSTSDSETSRTRVPYDSSSEVASETEMDYGLGSDSEYDGRSSDANVPYNSDSDME